MAYIQTDNQTVTQITIISDADVIPCNVPGTIMELPGFLPDMTAFPDTRRKGIYIQSN